MKTQSFMGDIDTSNRSETFKQGLPVRSRGWVRNSLSMLFLLAMAFVFLFASEPARAQLTYAYPSTKYCASDPPTSFAGHITQYTLPTATDNNLVNCSMANDQFDTNYYGAMNQYDWIGSAACGACVSIKGPNGATTLKIVDQCPYVSPNLTWCFSGSHHIDCSAQVASIVGGSGDHNASINWTFIECPLSFRTKKSTAGTVSYIWKYGTGQYYGNIAFFDYLFPLVSVQQNYSGTWTTCTRTAYNFFLCAGASGAPGSWPCTFRLTDARNNSITITAGSSSNYAGSYIQPNQYFYTTCTVADSGLQFPSCNTTPVITATPTKTNTPSGPTSTPTRTGTPTSTLTPIPCTSVNDFETGTLVSPYTGQAWSSYAYGTGAVAVTAATCAGYTGTYAMQFGGSGATSDGSAGWGINNSLGATMNLSSTMSYLRFDIRTTSSAAASVRFNVVSSAVTTSVESNWGSSFVVPTSWTSVTLSVGSFDQTFGSTTTKAAALAVATAFQFQCNNQSGSITLQIDNICLGTTQATSTPTRTPTITSTPGGVTSCCYPYDNFEDGDLKSYYSGQTWNPYQFVSGVTIAAVTCAGANGTNYGMQFGGSGAVTSGASGWGIANSFGTGVTTNLSNIVGFSCYIRATSGTAVSMRFNVVSGAIGSNEGNWGSSFIAPTSWTAVTFLYANFDQTYTSTTPTSKATALASATGIQFQCNNQPGSITMQIDEICLMTSACTPTATFTRTPTITPTGVAGGCWLVSNFDAGNNSNTYGYAWNSYSWSTGTNTSATVDSTSAYSGYSIFWSGTNTSATGSDGFGCETSLGGANISTYFNGMSFYVKSSRAATIRVQINSNAQSSSNGPYGSTFTTSTGWTLVSIPLASWTQEYNTGGISLAACLANVNMIQWVTSGNAYTSALTIGLDNVCITSNVTPTMSPTYTPSRTFTITPTATRTGTSTVTPNNTSTFTSTTTPTNTPTFTASSTNSFTSTPTKTSTSTNTGTSTNTPSPTNTTVNNTSTFTPTVTATTTGTSTRTWTVTSTPSSTNTASATPTWTSTRTNTPTNTPSATPTVTTSVFTSTSTSTPTTTTTWTFTRTNTPTNTASATSTKTNTPTVTNTSTVSFTPTWSVTGTQPPTDTYTVTNTPTYTSTVTNTATSTRTNTSTPTRTSTSTATYTSTTVAVLTSTSTSTPTSVNTVPNTNTFTATSTPTKTSTPTWTFTNSPTRTGTATVTNTATVTSSSTPTTTGTQPPTGTFTWTGTPTNTFTETLTPTSTWTDTNTASPTFTETATATLTWTDTLTSTRTVTPTNTATPPFTWTVTYTPTNTSTATWTGTPTSTATNTWTGTYTKTATATSTSTWTDTFTNTSTATVTPTWTSTFTNTATPTWTNTFTFTSTSTPTWTSTSSATNTFTPTTTSTITLTPTHTPVDLKCRLTVSSPYPNPMTGKDKMVKVNLSANPNCPKTVNVAVYTAAYRKIFNSTVYVPDSRSVWVWKAVDSDGAPVASGVYYVRVEESGNGTVLKWAPIVILK